MMIIYSFEIDINKDGAFSDPVGILSARLISASWILGITDNLRQMSTPLQVRVSLHDPHLDFSRDVGRNPFGAVLRGKMGRLRATVGEDTYTLFTAWITSVSTDERNGGAITTLTLEDKMLFMQDSEYLPKVSTDILVSDEIQNVFASAFVGYPYESSFWVMGGSNLGVNTYLYENTHVELEASQTTLEYAGDAADRGNGVSALGYIMDLLTAEVGGRFFVDRAGKFQFQSRHHDLIATVSDTFTDADYVDFGVAEDTVYNEITVNYFPRQVGTPGSILFQSDSVPFSVSGGSSRKISARYRDPDNEDSTVGAKDVIPLVENTDIRVNSEEDGSGTDLIRQVKIMYEIGGTSTQITITNPEGGATAHVTFLQVRGTPLITHESEQVQNLDVSSLYNYGYSPMKPIDARFVSKLALAQGFANQLTKRFSNPQVVYTSINFLLGRDDAHNRRVLGRVIGDRITVKNNISGHDADYAIVGEQHQLAGKQHAVRYLLRPANRTKAWVLGYARLGSETLLGL